MHERRCTEETCTQRGSGLDGIFYWPSWFGPAILFDRPTWWGGSRERGGGVKKRKEATSSPPIQGSKNKLILLSIQCSTT